MKKIARIVAVCASALILISWDQTSKNMAKTHLKYKAPVSYFHDSFRFEYAENTGAAMSLGDHLSDSLSFWIFGILPSIALVALFIYTIKNKRNNIACVLIFSGGIGNISDRLIYHRHVTDFMNIGLNNLRTGIFNFADIYITAGAILFLIAAFDNRHRLSV